MRTGALVVTCNRCMLLKRCLDALAAQVRKPDVTVVVDNASTDGTIEELEARASERLQVVACASNLGSAGGFEQGFRKLSDLGVDAIWTMDDDVIPEPGALQELIEASEANPTYSFLCSNVVSKDGAMMNIPHLNIRGTKTGEPEWNKHLALGCVEISAGTWVSALFPNRIWQKIGYPMGKLYIWGDDIEYTRRCYSAAPGLLVGKSVAAHLRISGSAINILDENDPKRVRNYYYYYRNITFIRREYDGAVRLGLSIARSISIAVLCLLKRRSILRAIIVLKGVIHGLFFQAC
jgi:GT2 family glycosyltransferase